MTAHHHARWRPAGGATLWPTARRSTAALAAASGAATGVVAFLVCDLLADDGEQALAAVLGIGHVLVTLWVVFNPRSLAMQVILGSLLAATPLVAGDGNGAALGMVPIVTGVVATSELLGLSGRLGMVVARDPTTDRTQVLLTTLGAATASSMTVGVGVLAGPGGLVAVVLGAAACAGLALLLVQGAES